MPDSYSLDAGPSQPLPEGIHWIGPNLSVSRRSKMRMGMVAVALSLEKFGACGQGVRSCVGFSRLIKKSQKMQDSRRRNAFGISWAPGTFMSAWNS